VICNLCIEMNRGGENSSYNDRRRVADDDGTILDEGSSVSSQDQGLYEERFCGLYCVRLKLSSAEKVSVLWCVQ